MVKYTNQYNHYSYNYIESRFSGGGYAISDWRQMDGYNLSRLAVIMATKQDGAGNQCLGAISNREDIYYLAAYHLLLEVGEINKEAQETYLLKSRLPAFKRRVAQAEQAISQAVETCKNPAISFSFGKDSLVCVDIATRIKPDILIINIDRGRGGDLDEAVEIYDTYAREQRWNYHRIKAPREIFEIYQEAGGVNKLKRGVIKKNLVAGFKTAREQLKYDCEITGLRANENNERQYLRKYGTFHYSTAEKTWKCKPVLYWSGDDIWTYIISRGLPYLRWYDLEARFTGYDKARYSNWAGLIGRTYGRITRLKYNYPREYAQLAKVFPEIAFYV